MTALDQALSAEELDELGDFLSLPDMYDLRKSRRR